MTASSPSRPTRTGAESSAGHAPSRSSVAVPSDGDKFRPRYGSRTVTRISELSGLPVLRAAGEPAGVEDSPDDVLRELAVGVLADLAPARDCEPGVHRVESYGAGLHLRGAPGSRRPHGRGRGRLPGVHPSRPDVTDLHWHRLREELPELQLVLYDDERDAVVGRGQTIPASTADGLPGGVDDLLERLFGAGPREEPDVLSALVAIVDRRPAGRGAERALIEGMRARRRRGRPPGADRPRSTDAEGGVPADPARALRRLDARGRPALRPVDPAARPARGRARSRSARSRCGSRARRRVGGVDRPDLPRGRRLRRPRGPRARAIRRRHRRVRRAQRLDAAPRC